MPKGSNKMEKKNEDQFILTKEEIENNKAEMKDVKDSINKLTTLMMDQTNKLTTFMMDQTNMSKSSPAQKDTSPPPDPTTTVQTNKRAPPIFSEITPSNGGALLLVWNVVVGSGGVNVSFWAGEDFEMSPFITPR